MQRLEPVACSISSSASGYVALIDPETSAEHLLLEVEHLLRVCSNFQSCFTYCLLFSFPNGLVLAVFVMRQLLAIQTLGIMTVAFALVLGVFAVHQ